MAKSKIVITGATGFLGTNLTAKLNQQNISCVSFDRKRHDFLKPETLIDLLKEAEVIFHLAAVVNLTQEGFDFNVTSTKNLMQVASEVAPNCRIIFASSFAVYKPPKKGEIIDEKFDLDPRNIYGLSKLKCEQLLSSTDKVKSVSLRFSNIYGYNPKPNSHSVVSTFINQINSKKTIHIVGDGSQERDFLYIDDAVDALILSSQVKKLKYPALNICSMEQVSVLKLATMIEAVLGKKAKMEFRPDVSSESGNWRADNILARKNLSWRPKIKLSQGLQLTISRSKTIN